MSRKGKMAIKMPKGVEVKMTGTTVTVKGPKGTLTQEVVAGISLDMQPDQMLVLCDGKTPEKRRLHGLYRSLIANMVIGASVGFEKKLEMVGVGYRASVQGNILDVQIGFSHPTQFEIPKGIAVKVEKNTAIFITGHDKQAVGQFAAEVRAVRPPEPYQGKGIRYADEYVRRKAGKAAKTVTK